MTATISPGLPESVIEKISHDLSEDWHRFGINIGFSHSQLENLKASFQTMGLCYSVARMLEKWGRVALEMWKLESCLRFLGNILEELERNDILEKLDLDKIDGIGNDTPQLDVEMLNKLNALCLCIQWPSNIDVRLLSRIEKWKYDAVLMYETRAYKHIRDLVDRENIVIIIGKQGDGKTFIAEQLLLHYLKIGFELVLVTSPEEWRQKWNPNIKQVIFIDDVFGKSQAFPSLELERWVILGQEIKECFESTSTKVISTVREYIHKDCQSSVRGVEIFRNIVNISNHQWKLDVNEKLGMLGTHIRHFNVKLTRNKVRDMAMNDYIQGFPLRCRLFFADQHMTKQGCQFFLGHLSDVLVDEINYLEQTNKMKYFTLVMLMLCDGLIHEDAIKPHQDYNLRSRIVNFFGLRSVAPIETLFKTVKAELGFPETITLADLFANLQALTGTYVVKLGSTFRFIHESVAEAVVYIFGNSERHQQMYLTKCSLDELQQRVYLSPTQSSFNRTTSVTVHQSSFQALAMRLTQEIISGHMSDLLTDNRFLQEGFPEHWKTYLSGLDPKKLKSLLEMKDKRGNTFVSIVARRGCLPLLSLILETPLTPSASHLMLQAASTGKAEAVQMLLDHGANINEQTSLGQTALLLSTVEGHISLANFLLERGADINITDSQGCCPIHSASAHGQLSIVRQLLDKGANVDAKDNIGSTPIFYASLKGHRDIVELLMDHNADITITNKFGGAPLLASCVNGHVNVLQLILRKMPHLNAKDFKGKTPLHWASQRGFVEIVEILLAKGVDTNCKDEKLQTPLHLAAIKGNTYVWRMLVEAGADIYATDTDSKTPVSLANRESKIPMLFG